MCIHDKNNSRQPPSWRGLIRSLMLLCGRTLQSQVALSTNETPEMFLGSTEQNKQPTKRQKAHLHWRTKPITAARVYDTLCDTFSAEYSARRNTTDLHICFIFLNNTNDYSLQGRGVISVWVYVVQLPRNLHSEFNHLREDFRA